MADNVFNIPKLKNFSEWYLELVRRTKLIDQRSPVKGFDVFMPYSYRIWEQIQGYMNPRMYETGHRNCYFPLVIPENLLHEEAEHFDGFVPECAWVSHGGDSKLDTKLAIRPTSETIMYYMFALWIRSYNDLPVKINQWCNIVRWETKQTRPFLRSREFLWQEGHTAHATKEDAVKEIEFALELYTNTIEKLLAIPTFPVRRPSWDRFAGASDTISMETLMPDGKVLQAGTAHDLGQNFSKPFNIQFLDENNKKQHAWQTSWGVSTRLIGALVMEHGDDKGLILPPKIAPIRIVIIPILFKGKEKPVLKKCEELKKKLGTDVEIDASDKRPGEKHYYWEMMGVPLRMEVGPRDIENKVVVIARRDTGGKETVKQADIEKRVQKLLDDIQDNLFKRAKETLDKGMHEAKTKEDVKQIIENRGGIVKVPFCEVDDSASECAELLKDYTGGGEIRGTLYPEPEKAGGKCVVCGKNAKYYVYVAKAY